MRRRRGGGWRRIRRCFFAGCVNHYVRPSWCRGHSLWPRFCSRWQLAGRYDERVLNRPWRIRCGRRYGDPAAFARTFARADDWRFPASVPLSAGAVLTFILVPAVLFTALALWFGQSRALRFCAVVPMLAVMALHAYAMCHLGRSIYPLRRPPGVEDVFEEGAFAALRAADERVRPRVDTVFGLALCLGVLALVSGRRSNE